MVNPRLARRYAKALYDLAKERGEEVKVLSDMNYFDELCEESRDFKNFVKSPIINPQKKEDVFNEILKGKVQPITLDFILLLTRKGREKGMDEIAKSYREIYNSDKDIKILKLHTAQKLEQDEIDKIVNKVKSQIDAKELEVEVTVNPDLIGGFVVEVEDKLFDASVQRDLRDIRNQFHKNYYISTFR